MDEVCNVCDGTDFALHSGFYYCTNCGQRATKLQEIEEQNTEGINQFEDTIRKSSHKIKDVSKSENNELTTWEAFNYILYGYVNELIELGCKEEIMLATLQLWTAYLQKNEVAFYGKKETDLPKFNFKYKLRDVRLVYNLPKKRRRSRSSASSASGSGSIRTIRQEKRALRKEKRSLADVEYQEYISSQKSDISSVGYNLSQGSSTGLSSENSEASIRIEYSQRTRKKARTRMSRSHLKKHQNDPGRTLKCHNFRDAEKIGRTFVFALLYLALNEIGDDIQISDILRYIKESHLKYNNISSFLPANIDCSQAISDFRKSAIFCESHYRIREKASSIAKVIHMHKMKTPDLGKLCERFIKELCLPSALVHIIKNLIDFYPPEMKIRFKNAKTIPNFEGRAMAYIIFVLKLLFGLDGEREEKISNSAEKINSTLAEVDDNKTSGLFVWSEWVKYVEMRNIILSQCHYPTAMHLDPNASIHPDLYIDYLKKTNEDSAFRENFHKTEMDNIHIIFERLIQLHDNNSGTSVSFPPSTTPFSSYMEQILRNELIKMKINVPDFMYVDHERRDIKSYVNSKDLKEVFKKFDLNLRTNKIGYNKNVTFVPLPTNASNRNHDYVTFDFNISVEEWHESLDQKNVNSVEADLEKFSNQKQIEVAEHLDKMKREEDEPRIMANRRSSESPNGTKSLSFTQDHSTPPVFSIPSYQYFDEQEQDINDDFILSEPRRNLEETNSVLVDSSSDEETDAAFDVNENTIEFTVSNNDYWIFMENIRNMTNISFEEELRKLPSSFQWLLKQCALQLHMQVKDLYIELLAIENQFRYVLKPMHKMKNCIKYRDNKKLPPRLLTAVNNLRTIW